MTLESRNVHPDRTINLDTWEEFEEKLQELRKERRLRSAELLFRGQGNFDWKLLTTLDRSPVERERSFQGCYESIYRAKPAILRPASRMRLRILRCSGLQPARPDAIATTASPPTISLT